MNKEEILTKLRDMKPVLSEKYDLTMLALFGSYSRDEQTSESDIDLLIDFDKVSAKNFFRCAFELEDSFKGKKVQIVVRDGIKPQYFELIKSDLIYA